MSLVREWRDGETKEAWVGKADWGKKKMNICICVCVLVYIFIYLYDQ